MPRSIDETWTFSSAVVASEDLDVSTDVLDGRERAEVKFDLESDKAESLLLRLGECSSERAESSLRVVLPLCLDARARGGVRVSSLLG